jgi:hypothetical protein
MSVPNERLRDRMSQHEQDRGGGRWTNEYLVFHRDRTLFKEKLFRQVKKLLEDGLEVEADKMQISPTTGEYYSHVRTRKRSGSSMTDLHKRLEGLAAKWHKEAKEYDVLPNYTIGDLLKGCSDELKAELARTGPLRVDDPEYVCEHCGKIGVHAQHDCELAIAARAELARTASEPSGPSLSEQMQGDLEPLPGKRWDNLTDMRPCGICGELYNHANGGFCVPCVLE